MSKRDRSTAGAFDAFARAIAGLDAVPNWAALPPATAPASLARALGQGVLHGRLPQGGNGARGAGALPLPVEQMKHEGQRSVAELGTLLWHAMDGQRDAPEFAPWMIPPHADPIVALSLSRRRLAEYAAREGVDRTCAFPGPRVWLIEIERAKGDTPAGIAVWRSRGSNGEWRTRCACVWTHGRIGSTSHPLVIGAQWAIEGNGASAGACVLGASWDHATRAATDASRNAVLARRQNAIGKQMIAQIVVPAALAWLDAHGGNARPAGHVGEARAREAAGHAPCRPPSRIVAPVPGAARTPPPGWLSADVERAVEAIVIGAAREGYRLWRPAPLLAPLNSGDAVLRRFRAEARRWTTATPVVLPGCDHRRGRARPHRALARVLRHARLAEALVASATLEPAPRLAGSASAHRYRRPRHLAHYPVAHLSVTWRTAVTGPLALGAGAGYGLGLLVPAPD